MPIIPRDPTYRDKITTYLFSRWPRSALEHISWETTNTKLLCSTGFHSVLQQLEYPFLNIWTLDDSFPFWKQNNLLIID